ncbi:unnamed protein product [Callosobruchus maculatus]|uniref:DUF4794 domain-containing protein n=1 Tax=Callosobruchus maculatus TaxID=64391 RepID=A0A653DG45_CALMS|nr:unnamed protein product [Callosobruchus maculatus]
MKVIIATFLLASACVCLAEPPAPAASGPYQPRGWRPSGPAFNLPARQTNAAPVAQEYGPPPTTTAEYETTTMPTENELSKLESEAETIELEGPNKPQPAQPNPAQTFVVVPQPERLVYYTPARLVSGTVYQQAQPAKLVQVAGPRLAPVQAIPALAKIVDQAPVVQLQEIQTVPVVNYASSYTQSQVLTPYSSSYVQVLQ